MTTEYLLVDNGSDRQAVEAVGKCLPKPDIKTTFT